jgi:hypothetical protein
VIYAGFIINLAVFLLRFIGATLQKAFGEDYIDYEIVVTAPLF